MTILDNKSHEIIITDIDKYGTYLGYNIEILKNILEIDKLQVFALGVARNYKDYNRVVNKGYTSAVAAGSLFVYHSPQKAVLINFSTKSEMIKFLIK